MGENLSERVKAATTQPATTTNEPGTELERPTLAGSIRNMQTQFALAMPKGMEAAQLVRDALTALRTTRNLARCDQASVLGGLMTCAQLGLRPAVLGHAWLVPFWDRNAITVDEEGRQRKGGFRAQLIIGYQGFVELVHRSDRIVSIAARTVYTNDQFTLGYGAESDAFTHTPSLDGPRGEPRLYYAIARMKGGGYALTDPMSQAEMEAHRDRYAMSKKDGQVVGPWREQFEAMAHKTMIRRLVKLLPKSTELASAIEADETIRVDTTPDNFDAMLHGERPEPEIDYVPPMPTTPRARDDGPPDIDGEIVPDDDSEPEPEAEPTITPARLTRLHTLLGEVGVTERDDKLGVLSTLLDEPITSTKNLTVAQGKQVIDQLAKIARLKPEDRTPALDTLLAELRDERNT